MCLHWLRHNLSLSPGVLPLPLLPAITLLFLCACGPSHAVVGYVRLCQYAPSLAPFTPFISVWISILASTLL